MHFLIAPVIFLAAFGSSSAKADDYGSEAHIRSLFPFSEGIDRVGYFQPREGFGPGNQMKPGAVPCPGGLKDRVIYAASPGQYTKKYHVDAYIMFLPNKIPGDDRKGHGLNVPGNLAPLQTVCKMKANANSPVMRPDEAFPGAVRCVMGKTGRYTLMSDLFYCTNGKDLAFYRGYWEGADILENYSSKNPMLTSVNEHGLTTSLGRGDMMIDRDQSREFVAGSTSAEEKGRFLFFTAATPDDIMLIDKTIADMTKPNGMYKKCPNGTFAPNEPRAKCQ